MPEDKILPIQAVHLSPANTQLANLRPGDFILVHGFDFYAKVIGIGERMKYDPKFAYYTHAALYIGNNQIIEAVSSGIVVSPLDKYDLSSYIGVYIQASDEDRTQMVDFAKSCVGEAYDWTSILSLSVSSLFGSSFAFGFADQQICSGLVAEALKRAGFKFDKNSSNISPAYLAKMFYPLMKSPVNLS